jgi:transposase
MHCKLSNGDGQEPKDPHWQRFLHGIPSRDPWDTLGVDKYTDKNTGIWIVVKSNKVIHTPKRIGFVHQKPG